jgi:hypothetical protein
VLQYTESQLIGRDGETVGFLVTTEVDGIFVGIIGEDDGIKPVGFLEGFLEGNVVGMIIYGKFERVGFREGDLLTIFKGTRVGILDGVRIGILDGVRVGEFVDTTIVSFRRKINAEIIILHILVSSEK